MTSQELYKLCTESGTLRSVSQAENFRQAQLLLICEHAVKIFEIYKWPYTNNFTVLAEILVPST